MKPKLDKALRQFYNWGQSGDKVGTKWEQFYIVK